MTATTFTPTVEIKYSRHDRDYTLTIDGDYKGSYATYHAAEVAADTYIYDLLNSDLVHAAGELDAPVEHDNALAAEYGDSDDAELERYPGEGDGCPETCPDFCPDHGYGTDEDTPSEHTPIDDLIQSIAAELAEAEEQAGNRAGLNAVNKAAFQLASGTQYVWANDDLLIGSGSRAGVVHRVRLSGGTWLCSCEAAARGCDCWHVGASMILSLVWQRQEVAQQRAAA